MPSHLASSMVVLTRPEGRNEPLAKRFVQLGIEPLLMPLLTIEPAPVVGFAPRPQDYDLIVFVSGNAVTAFFQQLDQEGAAPSQWPDHTLVGVVGAATAAAVARTGRVPANRVLRPDDAGEQDSEALWQVLEPQLSSLRTALIVRGQDGREWLGSHLESAGLRVARHAAYQRLSMDWPACAVRRLHEGVKQARGVICLLTSAHSVQAFVDNASRHSLLPACAAFSYVVIHPRIAGRLQSTLAAASGNVYDVAVTICQPADDAILQAVTSLASL